MGRHWLVLGHSAHITGEILDTCDMAPWRVDMQENALHVIIVGGMADRTPRLQGTGTAKLARAFGDGSHERHNGHVLLHIVALAVRVTHRGDRLLRQSSRAVFGHHPGKPHRFDTPDPEMIAPALWGRTCVHG